MGTDITKYADKAMFEAAPIKGDLPQVHLLWATPDPLGAIAAACRMYEGKPTYNLADITDEERNHYWDESKKTHLKAPLEFVQFHFFLEGVDRAFTHQLVRQRTAVYAQESLRFAVKQDLDGEVALPPSIKEGTLEADVWHQTIQEIQKGYDYLIGNGVPAEDARGLMPHAVPTRVHYRTDLRNLLDHAGNRLCTQAQFIWRWVFNQIVTAIRTHRIPGEPDSFADDDGVRRDRVLNWQFKKIAGDDVFKPVCYALGHCPFTAEFDRGCTIRERVQKGQWDRINDSEWLLDPEAGRTR